jgi:hypothetical protein
MTIWQTLLLIYPSLDLRLRSRGGRVNRYAWTMAENEIEDARESFSAFPRLVERLTSGGAGIQSHISVAEKPLFHLASMGKDRYWPSPESTRSELEPLARFGHFDSIFVFWPQHHFATGTSIRSGGWGLAIPASASSFEATYASVANAERWQWQIPVLGEVWLHEWLHGVCAYFARLGYAMPSGDADGAERHGYVRSPTTGWMTYYDDLMKANVLDSEKRKGIPAEAWQFKPKISHLA